VQTRDKILSLTGSKHTAMHRSLLENANFNEINLDEKNSSKLSSAGPNQIKQDWITMKRLFKIWGLKIEEKQGHTDQLIISNFIRVL